MCSSRWQHRPVTVVAESLRQVRLPAHDPTPGAAVGAAPLAALIARSLAPPQASDQPPAWLRPAQHESFRRLVAAVRAFGGALLADPVGAGKTWIALAVADCLSGQAVCLVPATLEDHWRRAANRAGVRITVQSHEAWSRKARELPPGLVIIDESHRFRHPLTARYRHLAPALVGRSALLLSATPVVNRYADLAHQVALAVPDDVFAAGGTASLARALCAGSPPATLDHLVIASADVPGRPVLLERHLGAAPAEGRLAARTIRQIDRLQLSTCPATAALIRTVLAHAQSSSPAALVEALSRYRHLLLQRQDAQRSGCRVSRATLRRALLGDLEQLVFWSLLATDAEEDDLEPLDVPRLDRLIERLSVPSRDLKADRLADLISDGRVTVVFAGLRATVHHLRRYLKPASQIAWCCGDEAGIGPVRLSRHRVLRWFRPLDHADAARYAPRVLVTTDVASEGLDLHRAERVVHYDLPWTAVRLQQRAGRILRPGSEHPSVDVVRLDPPGPLERRLGFRAVLARKAALPVRLDLDRSGIAWQWRRRCARLFGSGIAARGGCRIVGAEAWTLAAVEIRSGPQVVSRHVLVRRAGGRWTEDPHLIEAALRAAMAAKRAWPLRPAAINREQVSLARHLDHHLLATGAGRLPRPPEPGLAAGIRRVQFLARVAWQGRRMGDVALASRALAFLQRGMTAGERELATGLATADLAGLPLQLARLPPERPAPPEGRLELLAIIRQEIE